MLTRIAKNAQAVWKHRLCAVANNKQHCKRRRMLEEVIEAGAPQPRRPAY